jgi:hypothetical protein
MRHKAIATVNLSHFTLATTLVFALPGCSRSVFPEPSSFLSNVDLNATVNSCSPLDGKWGGHGSGSGGGGSPQSYEHSKHYSGDLNCSAEVANEFVLCLKEKFKQYIESSNGEWTDVRESSDDLAKANFRLDYEVESRMGQIRVTLKESGDERFPTSVYIDVVESTEK